MQILNGPNTCPKGREFKIEKQDECTWTAWLQDTSKQRMKLMGNVKGWMQIGTLRMEHEQGIGLKIRGAFGIGSDDDAQRIIDEFWVWLNDYLSKIIS